MKNKRPNSFSNAIDNRDMPNIIAILTAMVILIAPFNRGLFFDREFFYATIFLTLVFGAYLLRQKVTGQPMVAPDVIGISAWGVVAAYLLSLTVALYVRGAVGEIIRWGTYLLFYYLVADSSRSRRDLDFYLRIIFVTGVLVALAGLGTAFGTFNFNGAFEKETGRILSTLQYANSLAIYLNAILIIGLFLLGQAKSKLWQVLYGVGNFLLLLTFIGTQSRGGWLVFPIVVALFILCQPATLRMRTIVNVLLNLLVAVLISGKVLNFSQGNTTTASMYWLWLTAGLVLAGVLQYGLEQLVAKVEERQFWQNSKRALVISAVGVCVFLLGGVLLIAAKPEILPEKLVSRFENINFEQHSVQERFYFYKDAIKVIEDYPLLGTGGKGWEAVYQKYQSYLYLSNQVHNHFLQVWVESGVLGLSCFIAVWIAFFLTIFRAGKIAKATGNIDDRSSLAAIGVAVLTLGLHSLIDFNLSLGAISLVLWCLFGLATASLRLQNLGKIPVKKYQLNNKEMAVTIATVVLAGCMLVVAISLETAMSHGEAAVRAIQTKDLAIAQEELEAAISADPIQASYLADLGQIFLVIGNQKNDQNLLQKAIDCEEKAQQLYEGNAKIMLLKARAYLSKGQIDAGIRDLEEALVLGPWNQGTYDSLSDIYFQVGQYYFARADKPKAKLYLEKAIRVQDLLNQQVAKLTPETRKLWIRVPMLTTSTVMEESAKKSKEYLGRL